MRGYLNALLYGFEPWDMYRKAADASVGRTGNPVADVVPEFNRQILPGGIRIYTKILPCGLATTPRALSEAMKERRYDIILGTGLASRARKPTFEEAGYNQWRGKYYEKCSRSGPLEREIKSGGAKKYFVTVDNERLVESLSENGIDASISESKKDKGFVCNYSIFFLGRHIYENLSNIAFAFFHTPLTADYASYFSPEYRRGKFLGFKSNPVFRPQKVFIEKNTLRKTIHNTLINEAEQLENGLVRIREPHNPQERTLLDNIGNTSIAIHI
ncbi:MAG: hypothetical protein JW716_05575 [Candidatus Aenigmarchaeota archaeon]|nr:hypothetical protein [Candidatus Aenigmarchaeota archaeon]